MKDKLLETNIETLNDYQAYRQEADDKEIARQMFLSVEEGEQAPEPEERPEVEEEAPEPTEGLLKRFAKDITIGTIGEGPRAIISGATKGINELAQNVDDLAQFLNKNVAKLPQTEKKFKVPQPTFGIEGAESPKSITGNLTEDIIQFLTGFGVAGKVLKGISAVSKAGKTAKLAIQSAIGDILAFDEQEQRLSSVIQGVPELQNPVTEFLETDPEDTKAEAKFKQALEGAGLGLVGEGLGKAIKVLRKNRQVKKSLEAQLEAQPKAPEPELKSEALSSLGDIDSDDFIVRKIRLAKEETEGLTAKQIEKLSKKKPSTADEIEINFARINGPEDLKQAMQAFANETQLSPKVQGARRGVRSNEVTLKAAEDIDGFKTLLERREGQALNAEQITSARNFYYKSTEKLMELAKKAADPTASDLDQYAFRKMVATHHATQKEILGARAEAGRALQAWSIASEGTPTDKLKGLEQILDSFGGAETSKELAQKLASVADGQLTLTHINNITQKTAYARTRDAVIEGWTAGLLTNPVTHAKNLLSNIMVTFMMGLERYGEALLPQSDVTIREANSYFQGVIQAQKEAFANAGRAFRTGQTTIGGRKKVDLPRVRATSREILDAQGIFKPFAYAMDYYGRTINNFSFNALTAGDEYSKTVLFNAQKNALAVRTGISKGLKGEELKDFIAKEVSSPNEQITQQAIEFAEYGTFTNKLGTDSNFFRRWRARNPIARFVVPFYDSPINIFKFSAERTPLAPVFSKVREDLAAGGTRQAAALAKIGTGSSLMMLGTDLVMNGVITGNGPSDPNTRAALMRTGWRQNSIKIGNKYYSYAGLEPLSTLFSFAATMSEILTNYESYDIEAEKEVDKLSTATIAALVDSTINKTFLQGIAGLMEAISDPERYGDAWVQRSLSSGVPSGVAAVERAVNPQREEVQNIADAFKARIPGFSDQVPKRRNVYGEVIKYRYPDETILDETTSGIVSLFNPFYTSTIKDDPLDNFLLKEGYFVNMPSKTQSFDKVKINLREYPEIYSRLVELRGQEVELIQYGGVNMKTALTDLVKGDLPQSIIFLSDFKDGEEKQNMINKVVSDYNKVAKEIIKEEFPIVNQLISEEQFKKEQRRN